MDSARSIMKKQAPFPCRRTSRCITASEALADRAGVELPKQEYTSAQRQEADKRARLLEINKEAAKYFYMLLRGERGARALSYFRKRELSDETMQKFGLGYSDQYSDDLYRYLLKDMRMTS